MIANLFDRKIVKVLTYFFISPGSRYSREEIKEKAGMNNIPLDKTLLKLTYLHIIRKDGKLISLNFEGEEIKIINELQSEYKKMNLPFKIFNDLVELTNKSSLIKGLESIYLFGSYAKLIYHEKSDIDIAFFLSDKKAKENLEKLKKINDKFEFHFFENKDKKANDPLIKEILKNGKKIL
jgi:predicted nucleotidyltransferase